MTLSTQKDQILSLYRYIYVGCRQNRNSTRTVKRLRHCNGIMQRPPPTVWQSRGKLLRDASWKWWPVCPFFAFLQSSEHMWVRFFWYTYIETNYFKLLVIFKYLIICVHDDKHQSNGIFVCFNGISLWLYNCRLTIYADAIQTDDVLKS